MILPSKIGFADCGNAEVAHADKLLDWWQDTPPPTPKLKKRISISEVADDVFCDLQCQIIDVEQSKTSPMTITVSDETGKLQIELRLQDARYAKRLKAGDRVLLTNVHCRGDPLYGHLEPALSGKPSISLLD